MESIKNQVVADMKTAMRARNKSELGTIRLIMAAIKQIEIDSRCELDDAQVLDVLVKMVKQRRDSITQYEAAGRDDLVVIEADEIVIVQKYLPQQMSADELAAVIAEVIKDTAAVTMQDIGKVMGMLKPRIQGRADMSVASKQVKQALQQ